MKKFKRFVIMLIAMLAVMLVAIYSNKYIVHMMDRKFEEERLARYEEVEPVTEEKKSQIEEISQLSVEEIAAFIEEYAVNSEEEDAGALSTPDIDTDPEMEILDGAAGNADELLDDIVLYDPWTTEAIEAISSPSMAELEGVDSDMMSEVGAVSGYIHMESEDIADEIVASADNANDNISENNDRENNDSEINISEESLPAENNNEEKFDGESVLSGAEYSDTSDFVTSDSEGTASSNRISSVKSVFSEGGLSVANTFKGSKEVNNSEASNTSTAKTSLEENSNIAAEETKVSMASDESPEETASTGTDLEGYSTTEKASVENGQEETALKDGNSSETNTWEAGSVHENVNRVAELGLKAVENMKDNSNQNEYGTESSEDSIPTEDANSLEENNHIMDGQIEGEKLTLADRHKFHTSSEETRLWAEADNKVLAENKIDFSDKKITCLGDSVTQGTNLDGEEGYEQYTYPSQLGRFLNAESVTNLGIGGSSLGRYWDHAFCDRYTEIPEDTDIIIVMGGYNDGFCLTQDLVGSPDECAKRTLYGDVDELFRGLQEHYPDAEIIIMTPMSNLLHDVLRKDRPELLPQTVVVNCLLELANRYDFDVIDNYDADFLDSHDPEIVADYLPDSVHPNKEGYELFAKHVAAEIIRIYERKQLSSKEEVATPSEHPADTITADDKIPTGLGTDEADNNPTNTDGNIEGHRETPTGSEEKTPGETPTASEGKTPGETPTGSEVKTPGETPTGSEVKTPGETPSASEGKTLGETPTSSESKKDGAILSAETENGYSGDETSSVDDISSSDKNGNSIPADLSVGNSEGNRSGEDNKPSKITIISRDGIVIRDGRY